MGPKSFTWLARLLIASAGCLLFLGAASHGATVCQQAPDDKPAGTTQQSLGDLARLNLICAADLPGSEGLDIPAELERLDAWAARVRAETDRDIHNFFKNPAEFEHSEPYYRVLMLVTVLQQDLGVRYNPDRVHEPDFTNSKDLFIHGLLQASPGQDDAEEVPHDGGTCVSLPVLYVAVGRRLGYPLKLATTKEHVFARWDDGHERFNIEATSIGLNTFPDEYYKNWDHDHAVVSVDESVLASGTVHSRHKQAIDDAGSMRVLATAPDGTVEAVDLPELPFYLGVQWHPERTTEPGLGPRLFERLVTAAR